jgi:transitional endoplasmic reticulum ATPase
MTNAFSQKADERKKAEILDKLRELGGGRITEESGIAYHQGRQILLPEGMTLKSAARLVTAQAKSMEEAHAFSKVFRYRPWDGAYALQETLREIFGVGGTGKAIHTFFGTNPPEYRSVEVAPGEEVRIPWGLIDFPVLEAEIMTGATNDPQYGLLFQVTITAPKKYEPQINGIWMAVEEYLKRNSIYKGKAIVGVGRLGRDGFEYPTFLDPKATDPAKVAYRRDVFDRLNSSVWGPIRTASLQRAAGMKLNRKTLLYGPYGTGKSLAGGLTARVATENGWTFIQCKTGEEDLQKVLKTAELYAPAVVFIEDIDVLIESDPKKMSELLEQFDGVSSKNKEVMVLMTSNHVDSLSKGMTRVGRIDAAIEIGSLDREGIERLISATFSPDMLGDDIDYEAIFEAMEGYEPAFIMGTFNLTKSNAIVRSESLDFQLSTEDFVLAADTLRNQHDTHRAAEDRPAVDTFGQSMATVVSNEVRRELQSHKVDFQDAGQIVTVE